MIFQKKKKKYWRLYEDGELEEHEFENEDAIKAYLQRNKNSPIRVISVSTYKRNKQFFPDDFLELEKRIDKLHIVTNCFICKHIRYKRKIGWYCKAFPKGIDDDRLSFLCDSTLRNKECNNGIKYDIDFDDNQIKKY